MRRVVLHRRAVRYFERLDERLKSQLRSKFGELMRDPVNMAGVKPMHGEWKGFYRVRHGTASDLYLGRSQRNRSHRPYRTARRRL